MELGENEGTICHQRESHIKHLSDYRELLNSRLIASREFPRRDLNGKIFVLGQISLYAHDSWSTFEAIRHVHASL
jgi:hypothetical protein